MEGIVTVNTGKQNNSKKNNSKKRIYVKLYLTVKFKLLKYSVKSSI